MIHERIHITEQLLIQEQVFKRNTTGLPRANQATVLTYAAFAALLNDARRRGWVTSHIEITYVLNMSLADFNRAAGI